MNNDMTIVVSPFARSRHKPENMYSHFDGSEDELLDIVRNNLIHWQDGYRLGVKIVPVPPERFYSAVKTLQPGDKVQGEFVSRAPGEEPRLVFYVEGEKQPAKHVQIILYHHNVLVLTNEQSCDAHWELISINAFHDEATNVPIEPQALMYNHFEFSGGTPTNMSDSKFVSMLEESMLYWKDKIKVKPV